MTYLLNENRESRLRERELRGLVRLTFTEMYLNEQNRLKLAAFPHYLNKGGMSTFRTDAWEAARVRLVQLLSAEEFDLIATYYMELLLMLDEISEHQKRGDQEADAITKDHIERVQQAYSDAYDTVTRYRTGGEVRSAWLSLFRG